MSGRSSTDCPKMINQSCVIILFSIHFVLKAEKLLLANNIKIDVIPVPRSISSDCGMAIEFPCEEIKKVQELLLQDNIDIARIYRRQESGVFVGLQGGSQ